MSATSHVARRTSFPSLSTPTGYTLHLFKGNRSAPWVYIYAPTGETPSLPEHKWFALTDVATNESLQADALAILQFVLGNESWQIMALTNGR